MLFEEDKDDLRIVINLLFSITVARDILKAEI